jgi:hypothetical protein
VPSLRPPCAHPSVPINPTQCLGTGWRFPWGMRVRLCEMLLRGVFDTLEEGAYIAEADEYLQMLQVGACETCLGCLQVAQQGSTSSHA